MEHIKWTILNPSITLENHQSIHCHDFSQCICLAQVDLLFAFDQTVAESLGDSGGSNTPHWWYPQHAQKWSSSQWKFLGCIMHRYLRIGKAPAIDPFPRECSHCSSQNVRGFLAYSSFYRRQPLTQHVCEKLFPKWITSTHVDYMSIVQPIILILVSTCRSHLRMQICHVMCTRTCPLVSW